MIKSPCSSGIVTSIDLYTDSTCPRQRGLVEHILQSIEDVVGDRCAPRVWDVAKRAHAIGLEQARVVALPTLDLYLASGRRLRFIGADRFERYLAVLKLHVAVNSAIAESAERAEQAHARVDRMRQRYRRRAADAASAGNGRPMDQHLGPGRKPEKPT